MQLPVPPPPALLADRTLIKRKEKFLTQAVVSSSAAPSPSPYRTSGQPHHRRSHSRALSLPHSLPSMKRRLQRLSCVAGTSRVAPSREAPSPFPRCSSHPRRTTIQRLAPIHLARRGRGGRGGLCLRLGRNMLAPMPHPPHVKKRPMPPSFPIR
jgi:hypothetical protein